MAELLVKESTTHKGCYYVHNKKSGKSRWLGKDFLTSLFGSRKKSSLSLGDLATKAVKPPSHSSSVSGGIALSVSSSTAIVVTSAVVTSTAATTSATTSNALAAALAPVNRRKNSIIPAEQGHFVSKYLADFQHHGIVERPAPAKPKEEPMDRIPFTAVSTNQEMHGPKEFVYFRRQKPTEEPKEYVPFDATTTNQSSYKHHVDHKPPKPVVPPTSSLRPGAFIAVDQVVLDAIPEESAEAGGEPTTNTAATGGGKKAVKRRGIW